MDSVKFRNYAIKFMKENYIKTENKKDRIPRIEIYDKFFDEYLNKNQEEYNLVNDYTRRQYVKLMKLFYKFLRDDYYLKMTKKNPTGFIEVWNIKFSTNI